MTDTTFVSDMHTFLFQIQKAGGTAWARQARDLDYRLRSLTRARAPVSNISTPVASVMMGGGMLVPEQPRSVEDTALGEQLLGKSEPIVEVAIEEPPPAKPARKSRAKKTTLVVTAASAAVA